MRYLYGETIMSEKELRSKVIRLAHQKPELRDHLLPLVKSASGSSWADHTKSWFEQLGKLVVKKTNKTVYYKNVHTEGVFFRIQGQKEMAWIKYTNRQFEFSMQDQRYRVFRDTDSLEKIVSTIAKSIDNV